MKKTKRNNNLTSRRGITIFEVVIALTVIVIVSAAAITLISSHQKLEAATIQSIEATNIAENAIECFRFADDVDEFRTTFEMVVNKSLEEKDGDYQYIDGALEVTLEITGNNSKINIMITNGDKTILTQEYTKSI